MARRDRHRWISGLCASAQSRRAAWRRSASGNFPFCSTVVGPHSTITTVAGNGKAGGFSHVSGSPYAITASGAVANADYTIGYVAGALTVTRAALTIAANDQTMVYGGALPALSVTYSGLVNGDTPSTFGVSPNVAPTDGLALTRVTEQPVVVN